MVECEASIRFAAPGFLSSSPAAKEEEEAPSPPVPPPTWSSLSCFCAGQFIRAATCNPERLEFVISFFSSKMSSQLVNEV